MKKQVMKDNKQLNIFAQPSYLLFVILLFGNGRYLMGSAGS